MKLWSYLKEKMEPFADRIAFAESKLTYREILGFCKGRLPKKKIKLCDEEAKEEQAISILRGIAKGQTVIPLSKQYGIRQCKKAWEKIKQDGQVFDDVVFIMFTSGTGGEPKGVMLTDENIISCLENIATYFHLEGMNRICILRSLVHISALVGELLYALTQGLTISFFEGTFFPHTLVQHLDKNDIDVFCATPTLFGMLARNVKTLGIKIGAISGERLTEKQTLLIAEAFPEVQFYNVYGLTEHSPRVSALLPEDFIRKAGSVGKPIGNVRLCIKDGELLVKSPCIMKGYYGEKKCEKIRYGWLYTGDMAHVDAEGYYYIDGRKDDMIIRAGVNLFPQETEDVLKTFPGVEDCLVYAVEDERFGQRLCAKIKGSVTTFELRKYAAMNLPPHLLPNEYELVSELEYTASGKKRRG